MRIKSIDIKNFRSYYGANNHFELSDGLTLGTVVKRIKLYNELIANVI